MFVFVSVLNCLKLNQLCDICVPKNGNFDHSKVGIPTCVTCKEYIYILDTQKRTELFHMMQYAYMLCAPTIVLYLMQYCAVRAN